MRNHDLPSYSTARPKEMVAASCGSLSVQLQHSKKIAKSKNEMVKKIMEETMSQMPSLGALQSKISSRSNIDNKQSSTPHPSITRGAAKAADRIAAQQSRGGDAGGSGLGVASVGVGSSIRATERKPKTRPSWNAKPAERGAREPSTAGNSKATKNATGKKGTAAARDKTGAKGGDQEQAMTVNERSRMKELVRWQRELEIRDRVLGEREWRLQERRRQIAEREMEAATLEERERQNEMDECKKREADKEKQLAKVMENVRRKEAILNEQIGVLLEQERDHDSVNEKSLEMIAAGISILSRSGDDDAVADVQPVRSQDAKCLEGGIESRLNESVERSRERSKHSVGVEDSMCQGDVGGDDDAGLIQGQGHSEGVGEERCAAADAYGMQNEERGGGEGWKGDVIGIHPDSEMQAKEVGNSLDKSFPHDARLLEIPRAGEERQVMIGSDYDGGHGSEQQRANRDVGIEDRILGSAALTGEALSGTEELVEGIKRAQQLRSVLSDGAVVAAFSTYLGFSEPGKNNKLLFCIDVEALSFVPGGHELTRCCTDIFQLYVASGSRRSAGISSGCVADVETQLKSVGGSSVLFARAQAEALQSLWTDYVTFRASGLGCPSPVKRVASADKFVLY